jgi:hypothetical protein
METLVNLSVQTHLSSVSIKIFKFKISPTGDKTGREFTNVKNVEETFKEAGESSAGHIIVHGGGHNSRLVHLWWKLFHLPLLVRL